jgi:muramoyltetrapeptide carboxypeptidase LdcA involved in peptidoglycan recycling
VTAAAQRRMSNDFLRGKVPSDDPSPAQTLTFRSQCSRLRLRRAIPPTARRSTIIGLVAVALNCFDDGVNHEIRQPPKASAGDRIAVLSPSFAAPGVAPEVHAQAMRRLSEVTSLVPVEFPTTRLVGASSLARADDLNAAFADPEIRAVVATIGGEDQITVIPYLDPEPIWNDPKPFLGYSDNTNLLNWLWTHGIGGFYGGSTQVHLGPGPAIDPNHMTSLRAALLTGGRLEITEPGESEDFGRDWNDPAALTEYGEREPTEPWTWAGPPLSVTGQTWGGCIEVVQWLLTAGRFEADPAVLDGAVLLIESSEELIPAREFGWILRSLGERGILRAAAAVVVARAPTSSIEQLPSTRPSSQERAALRSAQKDTAIEVIGRYNPDAVIVVGVPFGHTDPSGSFPTVARSPSTPHSNGSGPATTDQPRRTFKRAASELPD